MLGQEAGSLSVAHLIMQQPELSLLFLSFQLIHAWYDACVSSSLSGVRYCSMGLFTLEFDRGGAGSHSGVVEKVVYCLQV